MKEEVWGPIWGLEQMARIGFGGTNGRGREAAGVEQEVVGLAHKFGLFCPGTGG